LVREKKKSLNKQENYFDLIRQESGYFHLQATKPDTIGYALNDSPLGLGGLFFPQMFFTKFIFGCIF
jgi:hypothetical protein